MQKESILSFEAAFSALLNGVKVTQKYERCFIEQAQGRVLAEDLISPIDFPPYDIALMDGYAVGDLSGKWTLTDLDENQTLPPTSAMVVSTGNPVPKQTVCVVQNELITKQNTALSTEKPPTFDRNIRRKGATIGRSEIVFPAGTKMTPEHLAVCAALGIHQFTCYQPLTIGLITTGDEILPLHARLSPGKLFNSNAVLITQSLQQQGFQITEHQHLPDSTSLLVDYLTKHAADFDVIITIGGTSVSEQDIVNKSLAWMSNTPIGKVNMKPGKPFKYSQINNTDIISLPGPPIAAFTTLHLFLLPALQKKQGSLAPHLLQRSLTLSATFTHENDQRTQFLRAQLSIDNAGKQQINLLAHRGFDDILALINTTGFIYIKPHERISIGTPITYLPIR